VDKAPELCIPDR